jgi:CASPASE and TPR Repeat-associated protein
MTAFNGSEMAAFLEPSLVVHSFAPMTAPERDRESSETYLRGLWDATGSLGMSEARLPGVGTSFVWPGPDGPGEFSVLAARGAPGTGPRRQALMFRRHDVIGVAVALEDPLASKELDGWGELLEQWRGAVAGQSDQRVQAESVPEGLLGETYTLMCEYEGTTTPEGLGSVVTRAMDGCGLRIWDALYSPNEAISMWDGEDAGGRRIVAALTPTGGRDELSELFWWSGEKELARMALYQVHASKLRYEARVHAVRKAELAGVTTRVDEAIDEVLSVHRSLDSGKPAPYAAAERRLIEAQADATGLVIQLSYLRQLQRTVEIAKHNMAAVAPMPDSDRHDTMIDRDRALANNLSEQIAHDIGYAEAVGDRAQRATGLSALRLQQTEQALQRDRTRLVLFQTALLSALLTGLGAIATFNLTFDLRRQQLRLPLLTALVTLMLAAPVVAADWHEGYRPADRIVIGLFGAALGWLAIVMAWPSVPWFAVVAAAAGGVAISQLLAHTRAWRGEGAMRG